jgi:hypothetical protein
VITGGLPHSVLVIDDIRINTDWTSVAFGKASQLGAITNVGGQFYMRAAFQKLDVVSVNILTGLPEDPPSSKPVCHYARWTAGVLRDKKWLPLVEFPFGQ